MAADAPWREACAAGEGWGEPLNHLDAALGNVPFRGHREGAAVLVPE